MSSSHPQRLPSHPGGGDGGSGKSSRHTSSTGAPAGRAPASASPASAAAAAGAVLHTAVPSASSSSPPRPPPPPPPRSDADAEAAPATAASSAVRHVDATGAGGILFGPYSTAPAPPPQQPHAGGPSVMGARVPQAAASSSQRGRGPLAQPYASPPPPSHSSAAVPLASPGDAAQPGSSYASWRGDAKASSSSGGGGGGSAGPRPGDRHQRSGSGRSGGGSRGGGGSSGGGTGSRHRPANPQQQQQQQPPQQRRTHGGVAQEATPSSVAPLGAPLDAAAASGTAAESVTGLVTSPPSTRAESRVGAAPNLPWPPLPPAPHATAAAPATSAAPASTSPASRRAGPSTATTTTTTANHNASPTGGGVVPARSGSGTPAPQPPGPQPQQRSPAPASSSTAALLITRPGGEERPTVALSQNIMSVYEAINNLFYQERQLLLAAPAKSTARKYEDLSGHYIPYPEEEIAERYVVKEAIGKGSFGTVLHCVDLKYNESVAVKVIRSGPYFEKQGWFEAQVVAHLNNDPALQNLVVQLRKVFLWKGHMVLVFEPLSFSLYRLITLTKYNGVSLDLTRKFAYQMIKVLLVLEQHDPPIIHCDLKPENVLLRDPSRSEVRVIDFGSACYQQQTEWTPPPAQVELPASSPSRTPGPPWDAARGPAEGAATTTTTTSLSAIHNASASAPSATALVAGDAAASSSSRSGGAHGSTSHAAASAPAAAGLDASASAGPGAVQSHATSAAAAGVGGGDGGVRAGGAPAAAAAVAAAVDAGAGGGGGGGVGDIIMPKYIQSRFYRSPEVILELGYTTAIDRWSLGCFLVEMHTGVPLFPGKNEGDMVAYFTSILGPLPDYMIAASPKRQQLYHTCAEGPPTRQQQQQQPSRHVPETGDGAFDAVTPMTEAPGHAMGSPFFLRHPRREGEGAAAVAGAAAHASLEEILGVRSGGPRGCRAGQPGHDEAAYAVFCDFILKLLQYDPRKRVSCQQAIQHPFLEPIRALKSRPVAPPDAAASSSPSSAPSASTAAPSQNPQA